MFAKLILYPDKPTQESPQETYPFMPSNELRNWQLVADNLTTGKMIDLLVYLDELGFLSVGANPSQSD